MKNLKEKLVIKNERRENGITLIALVITIIVLLILALISIAMITGDNGIVDQANEAKEQTEITQWEERIDTAILTAERDNRNPSMEDIIQELIDSNIISNENQIDKVTGAITTNDPSYVLEGKLNDYIKVIEVSDLQAGDRVYYDTNVPEVGEKGVIECIVLYDTAYDESHGTNYTKNGIQIVAADVIDTITLGYNDQMISGSTNSEKAQNSYNEAIGNLNKKAEEFLNEDYASDARCVGSVPDNKNHESGYYSGIVGFKDVDENYITDTTQMDNLGIEIDNDYWLASRSIYSQPRYTLFYVRAEKGSQTLCYVDSTNFIERKNS